MLSDAHKRPLKTRSESEQYNKPNFKTLGKISEKEKIEVIETGFQLNQEGKISLKKYYKVRYSISGKYTLFASKGYSIKYESIRRTQLYKNLRE